MRRSAEFTATLRASRASRGDGVLVVHAALGAGDPADALAGDGSPRVGLVVPRAVGPAVTRNLVRRRLRHLLRERLERLPEGSRLVVRVLPPAGSAPYAVLARALDAALDRAVAAGRGGPTRVVTP
jgi:ribonuclease P protein component